MRKKYGRSFNGSKKVFLGTLLTGCLLFNSSSVMAAEEETDAQEFNLEPMVVTAQRYQTRELETPASVEIFDEARIKAIGAVNVQETLRYSLGASYSTYGPGGNSQSTMTSAISIRGVEKGTLVLVNGRPINTRGLVYLEKIPTSNVERIEVIRGGGSVLHGSEALGGVINIITKSSAPSSVHYEMGNYGQINTGGHWQEGKLGLTYDYRKWGPVDHVSSNVWSNRIASTKTVYYMDYLGSRSNSIMATYDFNDKLSVLYSYDQTKTSWTYNFLKGTLKTTNDLAGLPRYMRNYQNRQNIFQLNYNDDHLKGSIFYNDLAVYTKGIDYRSSGATGEPKLGTPYPNPKYGATADERARNFGVDLQYDWDVAGGKTKYLVGATGIKEDYRKNKMTNASSIHRYNYSVYASADHDFTDKTKAILSARYSWQGANAAGNLDKFTPQLQLSQKIGKEEYLYANASMSYKMPTLNQLYAPAGGAVIGNPDLEPQSGKNYEIGWKKNIGDHGFRVAVFNYDIEDKITFSQITSGANAGSYKGVNEDAKNTGLELEYFYNDQKGFSYNLGASVGNPKTRTKDPTATARGGWERAYDRYEINGGLGYQTGNWTFNLHGKYLFGRSQASSTSATYGPQDSKPAFYTTLNIRYQVDKRQEFYVRVENLLDRNDIANNSSAEYYYTPINFVIGYNLTF